MSRRTQAGQKELIARRMQIWQQKRISRGLAFLMVLAVSLCSVSLGGILVRKYYAGLQFQELETFCSLVAEETAELPEVSLLDAIKNRKTSDVSETTGILARYGYTASDFIGEGWNKGLWIAAGCFAASAFLFFLILYSQEKRNSRHLQMLTEYLERVNAGEGEILQREEDRRSLLQDEIYKTVTALYQTRDAALLAKQNYADNLANIAHQIKTPVTVISLSAQCLEQCMQEAGLHTGKEKAYIMQMKRQTERLAHLEESLLLLARIDAGTLALKKEKTDVFTLLVLAGDQLQPLFAEAGVIADIPELGEVTITADSEWFMEALINLMKNCLEHSRSGMAVHCFYEQNPLYITIRIWDEGSGFGKEDLLHLFERFYRGKKNYTEGIGIGLSLARSIIEMHNGVVSAANYPEGGACFEIRLYCH